MSVDFDAIAQRGRCETSQLKLAFPLLEQGYTPPFLARYRSDVLGGLNEANLWSLDAARRLEEELSVARTELLSKWEETPLKDASIRMAIEKAGSTRLLTRLRRLVRGEMSGAISDSSRLAVAMIAPAGGQPIPEDLVEWASQIEGIGDASAATEGLDAALAQRLRLHPKLTAAAVRWLSKNAKIKVAKVHDPHLDAAKDQPGLETETPATSQSTEENSQSAAPVSELAPPNADSSTSSDSTAASDAVLVSETETALEPTSSPVEATEDDLASSEVSKGETAPSTEPSSVESEPPLADNASPLEASGEDQSAEEANSQEGQPAPNEIASEETNAASEETVTIADSPSAQETPEPKQASKGKAKASQKTKKITPRQRRRRWLVGVLKPLQGKSFAGDKLSAFQVVMLARALRSQVAECEFQYDAAKFVTELQTVAGSLNRKHSDRLKSIVMANEAVIRETAEQAWWDDLQQRASTKLVSTTADTLRRQVSRGSVEAKIVLAIDAVGPKTVAATIVSSDGRVLLCEDLPGQLSPAARSAAVARLGELIHLHHVDLLVISNGPARRSVLIALSELIKQSPDKSIRWTLSDRSGADAYAGSPLADQEMKSTPRRFRAAAWLAFSVIQPAQALAKVDPLKLRLGSFQKELSEDALGPVLEDILISGASRGGVDVNSASVSWLSRLPGVGEEAARNLDNQRREKLFGSREDIVTRGGLVNEVSSRQAVAFLRVFGSAETLDGTLVHPDDYPLARRLASALSIELPPECPPGYETPDFSSALSADETEAQPIEVVQQEEKAAVEDFTAQPSETQEFQIDDSEAADDSIVAEEPEASEGSEATAEASPEESSPMAGGEETPQTTLTETAQEETDTPPNGAGESPAEVMGESQEPTVSEPEAASEASESSTPVATVEVPEPIRRPMPESKSIDKCIKEWQIGKHSTHQIVRWLCDPFGDSDASGEPPAVMDQMPTNVSLKPGDAAVGVVVGVMPFGVFVELA
ncbi:MAG: Tex-like N-terminal domain-containing protein, partial [Planctomycetota bacterium]